MGRAAGQPWWQAIELLAAFMAGEAANDKRAQSAAGKRSENAAIEYAVRLRQYAKDAGLEARGITFVNKKVGVKGEEKKDWDVEASILGRQAAVLKEHGKILAYLKRNVMPGYHEFFTSNGEKVPSGKLRDDAIQKVKEFLWHQLEEDGNWRCIRTAWLHARFLQSTRTKEITKS